MYIFRSALSCLIATVLLSFTALCNEPDDILLEELDLQFLELGSQLESGVAVIIKEMGRSATDDPDWWKKYVVDGIRRTSVERVIDRTRKEMNLAGKGLTASDVEIDFMFLSMATPDFNPTSFVKYRDAPLNTQTLLKKDDIDKDGFTDKPLSEKSDGNTLPKYTAGVLMVKVSGDLVRTKFNREWIEGIRDEKMRVAKVLARAPATAKVTILWHQKSKLAPSLVKTEVELRGTTDGWK